MSRHHPGENPVFENFYGVMETASPSPDIGTKAAAHPTPPAAKPPLATRRKSTLIGKRNLTQAGTGKGTTHRRGSTHSSAVESTNLAWKGSTANLLLQKLAARSSDEVLEEVLQGEQLLIHNMKKEYVEQQKREYEATKERLHALRTQWDRLRSEVALKTRKLHVVGEDLDKLRKAIKPDFTALDTAKQLIAQIEQSDQRAAQALSQKEVLTHMLERYRRESSDLEARVGEGAKARERLSDDIRAQANVLRQLKGDIHAQERALKKVSDSLQRRVEVVSVGTKHLDEMSSFHDYQLAKQERQKEHRANVLARALGQIEQDEVNAIRSTCVARQLYNSMLDNRLSTEEEKLANLESSYNQLRTISGCNDIESIVKKFRSRAETNQQLKWMVEEVRAKADTIRRNNQMLKSQLEKAKAEERQPIRTREVYHEVDKIDSDLKHALSQYEESRARSQKVYVVLEELRLAISRYLSKIENRRVVVPSKENLMEAVGKLTSKLTEMIAAVSQQLGDTVEVGREEAAATGAGAVGRAAQAAAAAGGGKAAGATGMMAQEEKDSATPYAVLNSATVTDLLYKKLMASEVDVTPCNLRITPRENGDELARRLKSETYVSFVCPADDDEEEEQGSDSEERRQEDDEEAYTMNAVVDRATVKSISSLVVSQNKKQQVVKEPKNKFRQNIAYKPYFKEIRG